MKKELVKIWGVGLTVVLVASLLLTAVPASAGTLSWSTETIPGTSGNVLVNGANVTDMDVCVSDPQVIWAVVENDAGTANGTYKSTDGGVTFSGVTNHTDVDSTTAGDGVQLVAIAPDDPDIVAVVADDNEVYATTNGGTTWGSLGTPDESDTTVNDAATNLYDIDISQDDAGTHYVAVAGIDSGSNDAADLKTTGNVWYFNMGAAAPAWTETNDKTGFGGTTLNNDTARAVAFSPNFASDKVMVVVTANATDSVNFEIWSFSSLGWNSSGASFTDYPVSLVANDDATVSGLYAADISLAPDYLGSDDSMRIAFIGLTVAGSTAKDGIYRLKDVSKKEMKLIADINSVAYDGTNLVAGEYYSNVTYYCADPLATSPTVSTTSSLKRPGGDDRAIVRWAGVDVVAGTSGTSSSFNISRDNGKSYNGLSLVDDSGTNDINDVALSADGSTIYLSVDDGTNLSLWRYASAWERVLAVDSVDDAIVRIAPEDADSVYVAEIGDTERTIYYSSEGGDTKWFMRSSRYDIQDIAVESASVLYVAEEGSSDSVSTSTNSGFTWATSKDGKLYGGYNDSIQSLGEDLLMHTSTTGYVSYSTDGNDSWTQIKKQVNATSSTIHVTASGLAAGDFIYAASQSATQNVRRWEIGTSTSWSDIISGTLTTGYLCYGIEWMMVGGNDVVYVLGSDGTDSALFRTLSGDSASSTSTWSNKGTTDADNEGLITGFTATSGSAKLWAIETGDDQLFSFTDTLAEAGPELTGPANGTEIMVNPVSGGTFNVSFSWARPSTAKIYNLEISLDDGFYEDVDTWTVPSSGETTASTIGTVIAGTNFNPNTTYYWRVRVASDGPLYSPYSESRSFTISETVMEVAPPIVVQAPPPAAPAPVITPEVIVPTPTITLPAPIVNVPAPQEVIIPPAPAPAPAVPTVAIYAIIIIGALLVIALIVLIMRTRRPI